MLLADAVNAVPTKKENNKLFIWLIFVPRLQSRVGFILQLYYIKDVHSLTPNMSIPPIYNILWLGHKPLNKALF
jgi:hypothetical protein